MFNELLYEDENLKQEREKCEKMLNVYKEAARVIAEVMWVLDRTVMTFLISGFYFKLCTSWHSSFALDGVGIESFDIAEYGVPDLGFF